MTRGKSNGTVGGRTRGRNSEKDKEARDKDEEVIKVVEEMKKAGVKTLRDEEWQIEEGLVLKEGRVYILKDEKLRVEIIWLHHDTLIARHGGQ